MKFMGTRKFARDQRRVENNIRKVSSKQLTARIRCLGCGRLGHVQKNCPKDGN